MLSKHKVTCLLLLSLLALAGCAGPYVEPTSGDTARIRILAPTVSFTESSGVVAYPGGKCDAVAEFGVLGGNLAGLTDTKLPALGIPKVMPIKPNTSYERRIPAGGKILFKVNSGKGQSACSVMASFVPEANADYELLMHSTSVNCGINVRKIVVDANGTAFAIKPPDVTYPKTCE